jgi:cytidyltransferase-like protein
MGKAKPIYSLPTLFKFVHDLKGQGKRICLTHGSFDLFHFSHLDLLRKSAAFCDFLIVGVDSDSSIKNYKSYRRPIINEKQRLNIISAIDCVDAVFIKDIPLTDDDHIMLYKDLMIDFITIGQKYYKEAEEALYTRAGKVGAEVVKVDTWQEPTTTSIIDTIVKKYADDRPVPKEN